MTMTVPEDSASGNRRETAKARFVRLRQEWTEQVACDPKLTPTALRVAMLLSSGFNHETHETFIGRETLASRLQASPSLISTAVALLKSRGHVTVRTVRRNNHYLMTLKPAAIGSDLHTEQVRKSEPNRFVDPNPNRQVTGPEQGSGANAPASHDQDSTYPETYPSEEDTHAPEGARPPEDDPMTNQDALDEIARAYAGPIGERQLAFAAMMTAIDEGAYHDQLVHLAAHHDDTSEPLSDFLWRQTARGRRDAAAPPSLREQRAARDGDDDNVIPF